jgi:putative membrane protein
MGFLVNWLIYALAIFITAHLLPGIRLSGYGAALATAVVLGLANTFIKPLLLLLTLPLTILTLGLFTLVINALLIMMASAVVPGFGVAGFWQALLFSIVLTIINFALSFIRP